MEMITLQEHINRLGWLKIGMAVMSDFGEMFVRGFVNSSKDMIDDTHNPRPTQPQLLGIVDKNCDNTIVCSNYMYQVINWHNGEKAIQQGVVHPIYLALHRYNHNTQVKLEQLYVPDLVTHPLYKLICSRRGNGVTVTEKDVIKYRLFKSETDMGKIDRWKEHGIIIKNGKAFMPVKQDEIVFESMSSPFKPYTTDESIKSIAQEILVLCRYMHKESGQAHYALFGLDEVTVDVSNE